MTVAQKVEAALRCADRLCDDCLSEVLGVKPRQTINIACRAMARTFLLTRRHEDCNRCRRSKIVNYIGPQSRSPSVRQQPVPAASSDPVKPGTYFLVSCVKTKRDHSAKAKDLYVSDLFRKARAYVELRNGAWFILSAQHGLVDPERVVAPYEKTLSTMGVKERRAWANEVIAQLDECLPRCERIVLLAGERYRELLLDYLRTKADQVEMPMAGLTFGRQLAWLTEHARPERTA